MEIVYDYDNSPDSPVEIRHLIETTPGLYPQFLVTSIQGSPVDVIQVIKALHEGTIPIEGTGWDVLTKHPLYPGQTRLQALIGEIIRLNDVPARAILGV